MQIRSLIVPAKFAVVLSQASTSFRRPAATLQRTCEAFRRIEGVRRASEVMLFNEEVKWERLEAKN